jgi:hypothetical protein
MQVGMRTRSDSRAWTRAFAAGLLLRPVLIVPMAPAGPLGGSALLPVALVLLVAGNVVLALGMLARIRPLTGFGIFTAIAGIAVSLVGAWAGLPMPWPLLLAAYDVALVPVGLRAWRELPAAGGA